MPSLLTQQYSSSSPLSVPWLFTETRGFHFSGSPGDLIHHSLPCGPRGYRVVSVASTGHEASFVEQKRIALTVPVSGTAEISVEGRKVAVHPGDVFAIGPSRRHSRLTPVDGSTHYRSFTIISPPRLAGTHLDHERWLVKRSYCDRPQLKRLLELAFEIVESRTPVSSLTVGSLEALIEELFLAALTPSNDNLSCLPQDKHARFAQRALEYMRENFSRSLSIPDIATAINVNTRTLQAAFKNRYGQTPRQSLNEIRIEEMRNRLLRPDAETSVTSAAMDAGLLHLGRSSKIYRDRYGELPSDTLRRSLRARPPRRMH